MAVIRLPNDDFATVHLHDGFNHYIVGKGNQDIDVQVYATAYPPTILAAKVYNGQGITIDTVAQMALNETPPLLADEAETVVSFVYDHFDEIYAAILDRRVADCLQVYDSLRI